MNAKVSLSSDYLHHYCRRRRHHWSSRPSRELFCFATDAPVYSNKYRHRQQRGGALFPREYTRSKVKCWQTRPIDPWRCLSNVVNTAHRTLSDFCRQLKLICGYTCVPGTTCYLTVSNPQNGLPNDVRSYFQYNTQHTAGILLESQGFRTSKSVSCTYSSQSPTFSERSPLNQQQAVCSMCFRR